MLKAVFITALVCYVYGQNFNSGFNRNQNPGSLSCPEKNGRTPLSGSCDSYIECRDGVPEMKLCPDGLLFNVNASLFSYPCGYPIDVNCGSGRSAIQPANPTEDCPHQYGYFRKSAVSSECGQFVNCVEGRGYVFDCPEGLAFSIDTYRCDWPDMVPDCDAEAFLGFTCPPEQIDPFFGAPEFRYFRSPSDCQRYFMCINGKPRLFNCGEGNAYNELINACDGIENVTSCASQYQRNQQVTQTPLRQNFNNQRPNYNRF